MRRVSCLLVAALALTSSAFLEPSAHAYEIVDDGGDTFGTAQAVVKGVGHGCLPARPGRSPAARPGRRPIPTGAALTDLTMPDSIAAKHVQLAG